MNWDKIEQLLNIYHSTIHTPHLVSIHQAAHEELKKLAVPVKPEVPKVEEPAQKEIKF